MRERDGASGPGTLLRMAIFGALVGVACGAASALFLALLASATAFREAHESIVYALPIAGLAIGAVYERWGAPIRGGTDLAIDTAARGLGRLPLRMAPMVLLGTVATHLFGGSAGREGTAVQIGASLADDVAHRLGLAKEMRRQLVIAGIAGGFGAVFGTPFAGALFALEVTSAKRDDRASAVPAVVASLVGDIVCRALGAAHAAYPTIAPLALRPSTVAKAALVGSGMALATIAFVELTERLTRALQSSLPRLPIRMFVGGVAVVAMWKAIGTSEYLGLGLPTIARAFHDPTLPAHTFAAKLVFTSVTLASGFVGGEVTPLFFVGATLGSVLARWLGLPIELGAGIGLAAVFGAAAKTPIALTIMAVELLGLGVLPYAAVACAIAHLGTGDRGIYRSQRALGR